MTATTLDVLFAAADASDRVLLVDGARRSTGRETAEYVARTAGWLASQGVGRGDVVAWQLPNGRGPVVLYRACWRLGAIAAPLHHLAGAADRAAFLDSMRPTLLVDADHGVPDRPGVDPVHDDRARPGDTAVILHTSGSSGRAKGVVHLHEVLARKATVMVRAHGLTPDDVVLMPAPLAHVSGLLNGVLVPGAGAFTSVMMPRWDPGVALALIRAEHVTFMVGPPTFFIGLEGDDNFGPTAVRSLRLISAGGAGVTPAFVEHTSAAFDAVVKRSYGSTEAPTVTTSGPGDDAATRSDTDGHPVGGMEVRIVDPATGHRRPPGVRGEVQVRGPDMFAGYTDDALTYAAMIDGWFRTGDLGLLDAHGRLTVTGRMGDLIIRGGENISAAEVEAHLEAHPAVAGAVAVGEPDDRLGERVCAFVTLVPGADGFDLADCHDWFATRGVARFRTPERVVVLDGLPVLPSGKADRAALTRQASDPQLRSS